MVQRKTAYVCPAWSEWEAGRHLIGVAKARSSQLQLYLHSKKPHKYTLIQQSIDAYYSNRTVK